MLRKISNIMASFILLAILYILYIFAIPTVNAQKTGDLLIPGDSGPSISMDAPPVKTVQVIYLYHLQSDSIKACDDLICGCDPNPISQEPENINNKLKEIFGEENVKITSFIIGDLEGRGCGTQYPLTFCLEHEDNIYSVEPYSAWQVFKQVESAPLCIDSICKNWGSITAAVAQGDINDQTELDLSMYGDNIWCPLPCTTKIIIPVTDKKPCSSDQNGCSQEDTDSVNIAIGTAMGSDVMVFPMIWLDQGSITSASELCIEELATNLAGQTSGDVLWKNDNWISAGEKIRNKVQNFPIADCNNNCIPDAVDISTGTALDCNNNGIPDNCDLSLGTSHDWNGNDIPDECDCLADLDGNGAVDVQDLLILLGSWNSCPGCPADLNQDGTVDVTDLLFLQATWGSCDPSQPTE